MRLLITGIGGLLGATLADAARRKGHEVIGVGRNRDPRVAALADEFVALDLTADHASRFDWSRHAGATVVHLAGETRIHAAHDFDRANVATLDGACRIARQVRGRLIWLSSAAVYSGPGTRYPVRHLHESDETNPATAYGRSKIAAEALIKGALRDAVILRLFSVLSPRLADVPDRGHLVQAILRALATSSPVTIHVDAAGRPPVRDYVRDVDVARAILAAASLPRASAPRVLNLCTGVGTDARQMVACAAEAAGREIEIRPEPGDGAVNRVMVGDTGSHRAVFNGAPASRVREFWQDLLANDAGRPPPGPGSLLRKG